MLYTTTIIISNLSRMKTSQLKSALGRYRGRWGEKYGKS